VTHVKPDELATFRAGHASAAAAIEACDRPDWALRLAFDATDRRKAVIRYAANIIPHLRNEGFVLNLIRPYPDVREVIDVYADNVGLVSTANARGRAAILGTSLASVLAYVIDRSGWFEARVFAIAFLLLVPLLTALLRRSFAWIVRRRVARLDDESAFAILVRHVARAADRRPSRVPTAMKFLRRNLVKLLEGEATR